MRWIQKQGWALEHTWLTSLGCLFFPEVKRKSSRSAREERLVGEWEEWTEGRLQYVLLYELRLNKKKKERKNIIQNWKRWETDFSFAQVTILIKLTIVECQLFLLPYYGIVIWSMKYISSSLHSTSNLIPLHISIESKASSLYLLQFTHGRYFIGAVTHLFSCFFQELAWQVCTRNTDISVHELKNCARTE